MFFVLIALKLFFSNRIRVATMCRMYNNKTTSIFVLWG